MRWAVDDIAKDRIPWLRELDKNYADKITQLQELKEWLFYKGGNRAWDIKDNFESYIKNINNPARKGIKERLMEVAPDLEARIEAINNIPKMYNAYLKSQDFWKNVVWTLWLWTVWYSLAWTPWAIVLWILANQFSEWFFKSIRKSSIDKIVNSISPEWLDKLQTINDKIQSNAKLTIDEAKTLSDIKKMIQNEQLKSNTFNAPKPLPFLKQEATPITPEWVVLPKFINNPIPQAPAKKSITEIGRATHDPYKKAPVPTKVSELPKDAKTLPVKKKLAKVPVPKKKPVPKLPVKNN